MRQEEQPMVERLSAVKFIIKITQSKKLKKAYTKLQIKKAPLPHPRKKRQSKKTAHQTTTKNPSQKQRIEKHDSQNRVAKSAKKRAQTIKKTRSNQVQIKRRDSPNQYSIGTDQSLVFCCYLRAQKCVSISYAKRYIRSPATTLNTINAAITPAIILAANLLFFIFSSLAIYFLLPS